MTWRQMEDHHLIIFIFGCISFLLDCSDKSAAVWKWEKDSGYVQTSFSPLKDHKYGVTCVDFSPYGTILATASVDGTTILWDVTVSKIVVFDAGKFVKLTYILVTLTDRGEVGEFRPAWKFGSACL